jgi:predicted Zn-dependent protease
MKKALLMMLILGAVSGCKVAPQMLGNTLSSMNVNDVTKLAGKATEAAKGMRDLNQDEEIALGGGIASNLLGASPLLQDKRMQLYVMQVGKQVAAQSERPDLPWHFAVLDDNEFNAFAAPGGYIFLTKGLLMSMRNEAELAGVLGHEIVHVIRKHHLTAMKKAAGSKAMSDLGSFVMEKNPQLTQNGKLTPALNTLANVGTDLYTKGLDKADEFEADRMGVVLAARAGYDPYGLPATLQTLQGVNPNHAGLALLFKTHPTFQARLDMLAKAMDTGFEKYETQPNGAARFKAQMSPPVPEKPVKAPEKKKAK